MAFPRLTDENSIVGAVQTNYTSGAFVQQPSNAFFNADISPAVTVEVLETNDNRVAPNNTNVVDKFPLPDPEWFRDIGRNPDPNHVRGGQLRQSNSDCSGHG